MAGGGRYPPGGSTGAEQGGHSGTSHSGLHTWFWMFLLHVAEHVGGGGGGGGGGGNYGHDCYGGGEQDFRFVIKHNSHVIRHAKASKLDLKICRG